MVGPFGFHPNKTMRSRALPLARVLVQRGHDVQMFMPPWHTPADADRRWSEAGVTIRYTALSGGIPGTALRLIREVTAWSPEIVHCFKPKAYSGLVAWWLWQFRRRHMRLVTDSDDWEGAGGWNDIAPYTLLQKYFFARQEVWGMSHCHALTVASRTLQSLAWSQGIAPNKVIYVPNGPGIGPEAPMAAQKREELGLAGRPVILIYSRLFEFNTTRLVAVLRQVLSAVPESAVLAVGASLYEDDAKALRRELAEAGIEDRFVNAGWVEEQELPDVLAAADVGLYLMDDTLLNRTKCPVKLADMLSLGLPLVAESVGQVPEYVIPGRTGLLRSSGDTTGLADDLITLLQNEDRRKILGAAAREHIQDNFSWQRLGQVAMGAYQDH